MGNWIAAFFSKTPFSTSSNEPLPAGVTQINDSVWELRRHDGKVPNVVIIFFHGLQTGDFQNAFWKTWQTRNEPVVWPKEWLGEETFRDAHILSVSYDSSAMAAGGQLRMYTLGENLVKDIILSHEKIGQNCPVILVGHSLGGIVIKQFVLSALLMRGGYDPQTHQGHIDKINTFLERNLKGVYYYATPHQGSRIADLASHIPVASPYLKLLKTLNAETQTINEDFRKQRVKLKAKAGAIGETLPTSYLGFKKIVVEEASARTDIDNFYNARADHFDVCKPQNKKTTIYTALCEFIADAAEIQISQEDTQPVHAPANAASTSVQTQPTGATGEDTGLDSDFLARLANLKPPPHKPQQKIPERA